jgi:hypothetical protein
MDSRIFGQQPDIHAAFLSTYWLPLWLFLKSLELFIFRDLSELAVNPMGINMGPPIVSREEFDPRKPDHRRRREIDRFSER